MFLYNLGYRWGYFDQAQPDGVVLHAVGFDQQATDTRSLPETFPEFILLDPNTYLWGLDYESCGRACANLASYNWVPVEVPEIENQWPPRTPSDDGILRQIVEGCLRWQEDFGVSRLILPAPLITDPGTDMDQYLRWVDQGLQSAEGFRIPVLVSLHVSDICLRPPEFETIIDQVSARQEAQGLYFCVDTSRSSAASPIGLSVALSLLEISYLLGTLHEREVFVNFADVFGLACLAVGATAFATGYEVKSRRLNLDDFVQRGGGGAFPRLFSLATNTMNLAGRDMERIRDHRLLRLFTDDETTASRPLLEALRGGGRASDVPDWAPVRNNVASARSHLIERLRRATEEISSLSEIGQKVGWAMNWLQNAESNVTYLNSRFQEDPLDDAGGHVRPWRAAFEQFIESYNIL